MILAVFDPNLYKFVLLGLIIISLGVLLRYFRQPYVVAYILAGVMLGEDGLEIITDKSLITTMGDFGLILLLFFIGMETSLPQLLKNWKIATVGTLMQVMFSVLSVFFIGQFFDWTLSQILVLGFIISLSSSAVVIKLLQDNKEWNTEVGQRVIGILLTQDILIVPMLIITNYLGDSSPSVSEVLLQVVGGALIIIVVFWLINKKEINLPFSEYIENDHELQVFIAFIVCFGCALITSFLGLSAAMGAFAAGIVIHQAKSTHWFHDSLHSFRIIFVALFFVSVGMLIDLEFLISNWQIVTLLILVIYFTNHFINTGIMYFFSKNWKISFYGGALLAQIGELSFVLAASAFHYEIISDFFYQLTIIVISLTLLLSPFWITTSKKLVGL